MKNIFEEVKQFVANYKEGNVELLDGLFFNHAKTIQMIEFYSNSRYMGPTGQNDDLGREKPFFNIVNANVDVSVVATDMDTSFLELYSDNPQDDVRVFLLKKEHQNWMREANYGKSLNEQGETRARYGGVLVKKNETDGLKIEVPNWKNMIVDPVDIEKGTKIEIHYMTPVELSEKKGSWDNVEAAIKLASKNAKEGYRIEVYEVEGYFPKTYLDPEADEYEFSLQQHFISVIGKGNKAKELHFYKEELKKSQYKYLPWKPVAGRGLGRGVVEEGEQAQIWTNDTIQSEHDMFGLASKVVLQTADRTLKGRNILTELVNGQVIEHEDNKPLTSVQLLPSALPEFQNLIDKWNSQYNRSAAITDALRGENPPSGQAYRLQALIQQQAVSQFDYRREEMGIFQNEIFTDWLFPYLVKKLKKGHILASDFSREELARVDEAFVAYKADQKLTDAPLGLDTEQFRMDMQGDQERLNKTANRRYLDIPDNYFDGVEVRMSLLTTGEQKNKQAVLESLSNIFMTVAANPQALQDKTLSTIFSKIVELSGAGISPVSLASTTPPMQGQMMQQPQMQPQPMQGQPQPNPMQ